MFKSIFSMTALLAVLLGQLIVPQSVEARRCEEKPPETLLSLYRKSSDIHFAVFEGTEELGISESGEDFKIIDQRKRYTILSTLKGASRQSFSLEEQEYRYEGDEIYDGGEEEHHRVVTISPGDTVLLFLKVDENEGNVILADYADAVKPMTREKLSSYEKRISELNTLFANGEPSAEKVVPWIIRTIEDPHTRWEGAFELLSGFETNEWKEERDRSIRERQERGEKIEDWELEDLNYSEYETFDNTPYARLLDDRQKQRLLDILFSANAEAENNENGKVREMSKGDRVLIDLVGRWGDSRFAEMLLKEISGKMEHSWVKAKYMDRIAKMLDNAEARSLASRYENIYYMNDDDKVEAEDTSELLNGETSSENVNGQADGEMATGQKTYGQLKNELVHKFTEICNKALATKNSETAS